MKRFHVHVAVPDLATSIGFYSTLFGAEPTVRKDDYAKWMLDEPRINFAISQRGGSVGVNHLGFQVDSGEELEALHANLEAADRSVVTEQSANCCYARSDKYWVTDPAGIAWESFHTLGSIPMFGATDEMQSEGGCCMPDATTPATQDAHAQSACCTPATQAPHAQNASACCIEEPADVAMPAAGKRARCCA
jgi:catechol 2,3-dioxygenase-like lactoylglutathione lyase family enzyme